MSDRVELRESFDRLLSQNGSAIARLAASFTNCASDRDDLVQEIALALWQALPRFRGESSERTFLFRVAHNRAVAYLAAKRRHGVSAVYETELRDPRPDPETGLLRQQQGERMMEAVRCLPVIYRQVITLVLEGVDYGEISEVLGISLSNVGVRLNRARQMLRDLLEDRK
jgi:RNA polymerase sigma factor (sigma-70 family)